MDTILISLCVGAAMVYMGLKIWHVVNGTSETVCGCGKACSGCRKPVEEAGACGIRDFRK